MPPGLVFITAGSDLINSAGVALSFSIDIVNKESTLGTAQYRVYVNRVVPTGDLRWVLYRRGFCEPGSTWSY